jgi:hypothetical protein
MKSSASTKFRSKNARPGSDHESNSVAKDEEIIQDILQRRSRERKKITLFRKPFQTLSIFLFLLVLWFKKTTVQLVKRKQILLLILSLLLGSILLSVIPGPHQDFVERLIETMKIVIWWVTLGILSSIGLGTGLHTFVLYLGPFIAQVTLAVTECKSVNIAKYGSNSFICPDEKIASDPLAPVPSLVSILRLVFFEAFLWGLGTAIGELPPYFVARAARLSQDSLNSQNIDEITDDEDDNPRCPMLHTFLDRIKELMIRTLGRLGFFGIMLFASVPNPLFDLAGLTAGTTLVPFKTFFLATFIGKAIIKAVFVQSIFVITAFSKDHLVKTVDVVERLFPFLKGKVQKIFDDYRKQFHQIEGSTDVHHARKGSILSTAWDVVLAVMISYFIISLINSSVQKYLRDRDYEDISKFKEKRHQ